MRSHVSPFSAGRLVGDETPPNADQRDLRLTSDRAGVVALEFAIVAPVFLFLLFAVFGMGLDAFYQQALDDSLRDASRQVQINAPAASSAAGFVSAVCAEFGLVAINCTANLTYFVQASTVAGGFAALTPQTLPASGQFSSSFFSGNPLAPKVPVLIQVAYQLPFTLPYVGKLITGNGTNSVLSTTTVVVEPYQ